MTRKKSAAYAIILLMVLIFLSTSCSVEKKLGKEFREMWSDSVVLVLTPDYVFKNNLKTYEIPGFDSLSEWVKDSLLIENSIFLRQISDSSLISGFNRQFVSGMSKYDFVVLEEPSLDSFMTIQGNDLLINIAQVSLEEFVHPYGFDYHLWDESYSVDDIDLNAVSLNVWVEVSRMNSDQKNKVLFASDFTTDELEGYFKQYILTGEMKFEYTIDSLTTSQIYTFAEEMGANCATYLYDYFLNSYVIGHIPRNYPFEVKTLHWDPERKVFEFKEPEIQLVELDTP